MRNFSKIHWKSLALFYWYERLILQLSFILLRILFMLRFFNNVNIQLKEDNYGHLRRLQLVLYESDHIATVVYINDAVNFPSNLIIDKIVDGEITDYHYRHQVIITRLLYRETEGEFETISLRDPYRFSIILVFLFYLFGILWGLVSSLLAFLIVSYYLFLFVKEYTLLSICLSRWNSPPNRSFPHRRFVHSPRRGSMLRVSETNQMSKFFNGMIGVKAGRGYIDYFKKVIIIIRGSPTASMMRALVVAVRNLHAIRKAQGNRGLVIFTKALTVILMQSVGKHKLVSTRPLGCAVSRTRRGLPRIIPSIHRQIILKGPKSREAAILIRIYMSIFAIYRVLDFRSKLKLTTITKPGVAIPGSLFVEFQAAIIGFFAFYNIYPNVFVGSMIDKLTFSNLAKASPSLTKVIPRVTGKKQDPARGLSRSSSSPLGIIMAAAAWCEPKHAFLLSQLKFYVNSFSSVNRITSSAPHFSPQHEFINLIIWIGGTFHSYLVAPEHTGYSSSWFYKKYGSFIRKPLGLLGKLGFKVEPAGKVRVFAMVDCFTQWALAPLHKSIFDLLSKIPQDGLYDQLAPTKNLLKKTTVRDLFSYDLSAATDRLPISIQVQILTYLLGYERAKAWADILVGRVYQVSHARNSKDFDVPSDLPLDGVRYAVGQPMGALSSWGMLALTHHIIVFMAAKRSGFDFGSFKDYALLGDDIVIGNKSVAKNYYSIMTELGVEIGLFKSLISPNGHLEFAKRFLCRDFDLSPVPLREVYAMVHNLPEMIQAARKYCLSFISLVKLSGYGYKILGKLNCSPIIKSISLKLKVLSLWYYSPSGPSNWKLSEWLSLDRLYWSGTVPPLKKNIWWKRFCSNLSIIFNQSRADSGVKSLFSKWIPVNKRIGHPLFNISPRLLMDDDDGMIANSFSRGGMDFYPIQFLLTKWFGDYKRDRMVLGLALIYSHILVGVMKDWISNLEVVCASAYICNQGYPDPEKFLPFFESRSNKALLVEPPFPGSEKVVNSKKKQLNELIKVFKDARLLKEFF